MAGAIAATVALGVGSRLFTASHTGIHDRGPAGVAAAYGYPSRCLSVTIPLHDPTFARADFNRAAPCGRYGGDPTAIFHWTGGAWRPVLDAVAYRCPVAAVPPAVEAALEVCPAPPSR